MTDNIMSDSKEAGPGDREAGDGAEFVFEPNEDFVKTIVAMGVSRGTAVKVQTYLFPTIFSEFLKI